MNIKEYVRDESKAFYTSTTSVDPSIIEKYQRELAEDYKKFLVEERQRIAKTAELSYRTVIA
jgi:hypothetical protein